MSFFVSCYSLCFKVYFVICKYSFLSLFLFLFSWNTFSLLILIQCVFRTEVSLLQTSYIWILFWGDIHLVILCLLIGALSPFKFTAIIDSYVLTVILLIVFLVIFTFFFNLFFLFFSSLLLWPDDYLLYYDCILFSFCV